MMEKCKEGRNAALYYLIDRIQKRRVKYRSRYNELVNLYDDFRLLLEGAEGALNQKPPTSGPNTWKSIYQKCQHHVTALDDDIVQVYVLGDSLAACQTVISGLLGDIPHIPDHIWKGLHETVTFTYGSHDEARLWLRAGETEHLTLSQLARYQNGGVCSLDVTTPAAFLKENVRLVVRPKLRKASLGSDLISRSVLIMVKTFQGGTMTWGTKSLTKRDLALIEHRNDNIIRVITEAAANHTGASHGHFADGEEDILPFTFLPVNSNIAAPEWKTLLAKIDSATSFLFKQKLLDSFRWLQSSTTSLQQTVTNVLNSNAQSRSQVVAKRREMATRLERQKREADDMLCMFEEQIIKAKSQLKKQCVEHLHTDEGKDNLSTWETYEIPRFKILTSWEMLNESMQQMCAHKIHGYLAEFVSETGLIQRLMLDIQRTLLEELIDIDQQYSGLGDWFGCPNLKSPVSPKKLFLIRKADTFPIESLGDVPLPLEQLASLLDDMTLTTLLPMMQTLMWGPDQPLRMEFSRLSMAGWFSSLRGRAEYLTSPRKYMKKLCLSTLDQIGENEVGEFIDQQFQPAAAILDCGRDVIQTVISQQRKGLEKGDGLNIVLQKAKTINESDIKIFQAKLAAFAENSLNSDQLDFSLLDVVVDLLSHGCFAEYRSVRVQVNNAAAPSGALLKTYKFGGATRCWLDEMNLSKCKHPHLAEFLGSTKLDAVGSPGKYVLVFGGHLVPASKDYFGSGGIPANSDGRNVLLRSFRDLLEQVALGLEYLHARGLVHIDLSLDTIMVTSIDHVVRLVNVSEPRVVSHVLATDAECHDCVYLAQEVLLGEYYRSYSDVYSLGLAAWELWEQKPAFQNQRSHRLSKFTEYQHVSLLGSTSDGPFSSLILASLHETPTHRIPISDWVDGIRQVVLPEVKSRTGSFDEVTV